jgi:hypothetical protein
MTSITPVLLALAADPLVRVEGSCACPTPQQVASQLASRLPSRPAGIDPHVATIDSVAQRISLELKRPDRMMERTVEVNASCDDLAEQIANIIEAWELEYPLIEPRWRLEWGASLRGSVAPSFVPGILLELVLRNIAGQMGGRVLVSTSWWNEAALGQGRASWIRPTVGLGFIHGWEKQRLFLDLHEEVLGGVLIAQGRDYGETSRTAWTRPFIEPGLGGGVRFGGLSGSFRLWGDAAIAVWPVGHELALEGSPQKTTVPAIEIFLSVGAFLSNW